MNSNSLLKTSCKHISSVTFQSISRQYVSRATSSVPSSKAKFNYRPQDNLSILRGPCDQPLSELTLIQKWNQVVSENEHLNALICRNEPPSQTKSNEGCLRWTFGQMNDQINLLSYGLYKLGIRKGDRVASWLGNQSHNPVLMWACAKLGAIFTALNPGRELDSVRKSKI